MNPYCTITPTRGDRPELLEFTRKRLWDIIDGHAPILIINHPPKTNDFDIVQRVRRGIKVAEDIGVDFVFIIEDDDYYPEDYFQSLGDLTGIDFVGFSDTTYYNLKNRTYQTFDHPGRSSLFCTGFRISALDQFVWPKDNYKWLDIKLWEYAQRHGKQTRLLQGNPTIGIKGHGQGLTAGKGHSMYMKHEDPKLEYLRSKVDDEAFEFYSGLMKTAQ